jgi:hypothetical protein
VEEKADVDFLKKLDAGEKSDAYFFFYFFELFPGHVVVSGITMGGHFEVEV